MGGFCVVVELAQEEFAINMATPSIWRCNREQWKEYPLSYYMAASKKTYPPAHGYVSLLFFSLIFSYSFEIFSKN